jgi:S-adenosylmethionine:tRNA ribosyltransferase-isomerase
VRTAEFDYHLPLERIAQEPAEPRDAAALMVLDRASGDIEHRLFRDIGEYLAPGDLLVFNDTRVFPARLYARKAGSGGRVEILLLEELRAGNWAGLVRGHRLRVGTVLELLDHSGRPARIQATIRDSSAGGQRTIEFSHPPAEWLKQLGHIPLPPYIRDYSGDPERYQTIFGRHEGSAAAPTAGLHFTSELLLALRSTGVGQAYVTLRIGLDTFKPIDSDEIGEHTIHTEWARLSPETARQINQTRISGGRIVAVGTTSVRALETAALIRNPEPPVAPQACGWSTVTALEGPTDLYITPGHRFRVVDALITNFHLPRSTLLVLVSAFAGRDTIRRAYAEAIERDYRFYSFGDAMLIL